VVTRLSAGERIQRHCEAALMWSQVDRNFKPIVKAKGIRTLTGEKLSSVLAGLFTETEDQLNQVYFALHLSSPGALNSVILLDLINAERGDMSAANYDVYKVPIKFPKKYKELLPVLDQQKITAELKFKKGALLAIDVANIKFFSDLISIDTHFTQAVVLDYDLSDQSAFEDATNFTLRNYGVGQGNFFTNGLIRNTPDFFIDFVNE
jgi:hypothetical protein